MANGSTVDSPEYRALYAQVAQEGPFLRGVGADELSDEEWDDRFSAYQANLAALRRMITQHRAAADHEPGAAAQDGGAG